MKKTQIEEIMVKAIKKAYATQSEKVLAQLGGVDNAVKSAIDGIDYTEVDGMTEKEAYEFYFDWAKDCIKSVL
ncbi:MAG: hypothetical protein EOM35_09595 [Negativicutes bacterium]|nr:hypothetical protein [Negativicutes bacterium]